jgi:hypothetical protein
MSLNKPILDDRSYEQIRDELVARIPIYAPEWTDHNPSDPGIALIELFSFLTENLLYRFNQIPDATKLEFLRLLQIPLEPAHPSRSMLALTSKEAQGVLVNKASQASAGEIKFTTQNEVRVLPVSAVAVAKIADELPQEDSEENIFYQQAAASVDAQSTVPYHVETVWQDEPGVPRDFDASVDGILWVAVLVESEDLKDSTKQQLSDHPQGPLLLNIGFVPETRLEPIEDHNSQSFADRFRCPGEGAETKGNAVNWQISSGKLNSQGKAIYEPVQVMGDTSEGLSKEGVIRIQLPASLEETNTYILEDPNTRGVGDLPPPIDDEQETRVLFWLRAFRNDGQGFGKVLYLGANATEVQQIVNAKAEFIGTGTGQPNQKYPLNHRQVIANSVNLQVEEPQGWVVWQEVAGFYASGESDRHYVLDKQAGKILFGTGIAGFTPQIGQRVRVTEYQYGGGSIGNVAAEAISKISSAQGVKLANPLAAYGGSDAESIEAALDRIPAELRRRNRAVTGGDFKELALLAPGANLGRSEVLPRYHPQLPDVESAGVVSVVVWPKEDKHNPNAPLPNRNQIHDVCEWLDARRLVTTELYVLPPKYVSIAIAVGVKVKNGFGIDAVRHWVELVLRQYLAPLPPFGPSGQGWPLGRRVHAAELEAAAHQVEGVEYLEGLELVGWDAAGNLFENTINLNKNEVPELIGITVESGPITLDPGELLAPEEPDATPVPIPVIREVC